MENMTEHCENRMYFQTSAENRIHYQPKVEIRYQFLEVSHTNPVKCTSIQTMIHPLAAAGN